jgi:hypothetical protein
MLRALGIRVFVGRRFERSRRRRIGDSVVEYSIVGHERCVQLLEAEEAGRINNRCMIASAELDKMHMAKR